MNSEVLNWLLEDENLAIKYRTMTEICDIPLEQCEGIYNFVLDQKSIAKMIEKQNENGLWDNDYGSLEFTALRYLTAFAEHGIHFGSPLDNYVHYLIGSLQQSSKDIDYSGCLMPLILRALVMLGYHKLSEVMNLVNKFAMTQLYDGGFTCRRLLDKKPERKSCYKASLAGLLLYAECKRKNIILSNSDKLVNYFIKRNIFYSSDKLISLAGERFGWRYVDNFFPAEPMRIGLPLIMSALSILGVGNNTEVEEAWAMLENKKCKTGKLKLEGTLAKQPCSFGSVDADNKWITFYALLAEKYRKKDIMYHIRKELSCSDQEIALVFVEYLKENGMKFIRDNNYWKDKIYYLVEFNGESVCFIAIKDPDERDNNWTVWSEDIEPLAPLNSLEEDISKIGWKHIDFCGNCGSCSGGKNKIIFGKEFHNICSCTFRIDNPSENDILLMKEMVQIRKQKILHQTEGKCFV